VIGHVPVVEVPQDGRHPAGGSHHHGNVLRFQIGDEFIQTRLFGRRCLKGRLRLRVQGIHDGIGVAVRAVEAAQHGPHGIACRAARGSVQPFLIRKAQCGQCGLPQGGPDALGVEHQPVHIKNNTFYHCAKAPF
jgi:hypothetical protein